MKQATVYFIKKSLPKATLHYIGSQVSYDHSTVVYSLKQVENLMLTDKETKKDISIISKAVAIENDRIRLEGDIQKEYYYINLNTCKSARFGSGKGIVLTGFGDTEIDAIFQKLKDIYNEELVAREHKNTGLFILEKND